MVFYLHMDILDEWILFGRLRAAQQAVNTTYYHHMKLIRWIKEHHGYICLHIQLIQSPISTDLEPCFSQAPFPPDANVMCIWKHYGA